MLAKVQASFPPAVDLFGHFGICFRSTGIGVVSGGILDFAA